MAKRGTGRRGFLGSLGALGALGAATSSLPLLPSVARADGSPTRLVIFTSPNNWLGREQWLPSGSGSSFALPASLPALLSPLEAHRSKLLLLGNLRNHCYETGVPQQNSHAGIGHLLTGRRNVLWADATTESQFWGGGQSVDQFVAERLGVEAMTLGARVRGNTGGSRISYTAGSAPSHPIESPQETYDRYFSGGAPPDARDAQNRQRRSVLGLVAGRLTNLRSRYGAYQATRIERHLDSLATIRERLTSDTLSCSPDDPGSPSQFPMMIMRQLELMVEALACGQTRVGTMQCGNSGGAESYSGGLSWAAVPELGLDAVSYPRSQHVIAHDYDSAFSAANDRARRDVERMYMTMFAYLLERMDSVMEGDRTLLDNSVVVYAKPMAYGHRPNQMLFIIAGSGGGQLTTGRYESHDDLPHNNLLVSLSRLMGQRDVTSYGDARFCTGDLLGV